MKNWYEKFLLKRIKNRSLKIIFSYRNFLSGTKLNYHSRNCSKYCHQATRVQNRFLRKKIMGICKNVINKLYNNHSLNSSKWEEKPHKITRLLNYQKLISYVHKICLSKTKITFNLFWNIFNSLVWMHSPLLFLGKSSVHLQVICVTVHIFVTKIMDDVTDSVELSWLAGRELSS
jgi:hypothetical protein